MCENTMFYDEQTNTHYNENNISEYFMSVAKGRVLQVKTSNSSIYNSSDIYILQEFINHEQMIGVIPCDIISRAIELLFPDNIVKMVQLFMESKQTNKKMTQTEFSRYLFKVYELSFVSEAIHELKLALMEPEKLLKHMEELKDCCSRHSIDYDYLVLDCEKEIIAMQLDELKITVRKQLGTSIERTEVNI